MSDEITVDESINIIVKEAIKHDLDSEKQDRVISTMIQNSVNRETFLKAKKFYISEIYRRIEAS